MSRVLLTNGNQTLVDDTNYDLNFDAAIQSLLNGKDIIAQPYPDFGSDDLNDQCPSSDLIKAADFQGKSYQEIADYLNAWYENFGIA